MQAAQAESCPVQGHENPMADGVNWLVRVNSQLMADGPNVAMKRFPVAQQEIIDFFKPVSDIDYEFGQRKIAHAVRKVAFSAALHVGATDSMADLLPVISDRKKQFRIDDHFSAHPDMQLFPFQSEKCQDFTATIGGVVLDWATRTMLDPTADYKPLAEATRIAHDQFNEAYESADEDVFEPDYEKMILSLSEDGAHAALVSLLSLAIRVAADNGGHLPANQHASLAFSNAVGLREPTTVKRNFSVTHLRKPRDVEDLRAAAIVAYERALQTTPHGKICEDMSYYKSIDGRGEIVTINHPSMHKGPWKEPGMCWAEPMLKPWGRRFSPSARFLGAAAVRLGAFGSVQQGQFPVHEYSTGQIAQVFGMFQARRTIYPYFPKVAPAEQS
jgi:hypothetical protein